MFETQFILNNKFNNLFFNRGNTGTANDLALLIPLSSDMFSDVGVVTESFTRDTTATVTDFENVLHEAQIDELRFPGLRRVENLLSNTDAYVTETVALENGSDYILSCEGSGSITLSGASTLVLSNGEIIFTATSTTLTLTVSGAVTSPQLEAVCGSQLIASDYVSSGVLSWPYHGAGVDGVKYSTTDRDGNSLVSRTALLEDDATNLCTYSSDYSEWTKSNATQITGYSDPFGGSNASLITLTEGLGFIGNKVYPTAGEVYTYSAYLKSVSGTGTYAMNYYDGSHHRKLVTLTEEWQRFEYTTDALDSTTTYFVYVGDDRDGTASLQTCYAFGAQFELGSAATSYSPTEGTSVTRTADELSYDVSSVITQGQGSLYFEFEADPVTDLAYIFSLNDGSYNNRVRLVIDNYSTLLCEVSNNSSIVASVSSNTFSSNTKHKCCVTYQDNELALYVNGSILGIDTGVSVVPTALTTLSVGTNSVSNANLNGFVGDIKYYSEVLSQTRAEVMTS